MEDRFDVNEEEIYDQFPRGDEHGFGPLEGFNRWVQINDPGLFTETAREDPVIKAFLAAPFTVNYAQFKSSYREMEYFLHKPHRAMASPDADPEDRVDGIEGGIANFPQARGQQHIATLVVNHELTLAKYITRSLTIEDGHMAGQMIHKEEEQTPL
jgi:hypothetical protein